MYDLERIAKIIADLERYYIDLENLKITSSSMSRERFYSLSMLLFATLNRLIDLAQEIIRAKRLGIPTSYREVFFFLEKEKLLSHSLSGELQSLASRRNVLAHEYFGVTEKDIYSLYLKMVVGKKFIVEVQKLIRKK